MSKIEAGRIKLEPEDFDLGALVRDVIDMMEVRAKDKGIQLLLDPTSEFPRFIHGDASKLRQILINLLSNSIKFTDVGGVSLRLDAKNGHPDLFDLRIEVEDSGCGIPPEAIDRIFAPFEQMAESASQKGTGLGLTITQQFVSLMEGDIQVKSELGKGSVFSVQIQVQHAQDELSITQPIEKRQVLSLATNQAEYRILIAEDQRDNQLLLQRLLEQAGFKVKIAENGEAAVALFQQWHPHFIWMDRRMPVMDGLTATRKIRQLPGGKTVKISALTASVFQEQKKEIMDAGCDDYIRKPYQPDEIFNCMADHLGLKYIYHEVKTEQSSENKAAFQFDIQDISNLPAELLETIIDLAMGAQGPEIIALLESNEDIPQGAKLKIEQLVNEYRFDQIVELCKHKA